MGGQLTVRHLLQAEGYGVRLRPVEMVDAPFIVWLRNQDYVKGRVGDSATDVASQKKWLSTHAGREGDYYFIVETVGGIPLGTNSLYDISGKKAEWGRYIIRPQVGAALPSAILIFNLAFEKLNLSELLARCVSTNLKVHSIVKKCGFRQSAARRSSQVIGGQAVDMVHFVLAPAAWREAQARLIPLAQLAEKQLQDWEKSQRDHFEIPWSSKN